MRPIFSGARRAFAAAVLVSTIASLPGAVLASHGTAAPVANSPTVNLPPYSSSVTVDLSALATDADGDTLVFSFGSASYGAAAPEGLVVRYNAGSEFVSTDSFTFLVDDGHGHSATGTVTVKDVTGPDINNLPNGLVLFAGSNDRVILPDLTEALDVYDNIEVASVTQSPEPGTALAPGFHEITFTATDLAGNLTEVTAEIEVAASLTVVKAAGDIVEGEPEGTKVQRFGVPSINQCGDVAYLGRLTAPGVRSTLAVLAGNPLSVRTRVGDDAVGIAGAKFSFFLDPVLDEDGSLAFIARVTGQGVVPENDRGVWVQNEQGLQLIAREGGAVPEVPGAQFERFTSVSMKNGQVLFLAELVQGIGGIDKTNDIGVWAWDPENGLRPFVREGSTVETSSGPKKVTVFSMLRAAGTSRGHGRSHGGFFGMHTLWARFEDGAKGIVTAIPSIVSEPGSPFQLISVAETRTPLTFNPEETSAFVPKAIGLPATNSLFGFASVMTLASDKVTGVNLANNQGIFLGGLLFSEWYPVARKGDEVAEGIRWRGFKDPIINNNYDIAWVGRLSGTGVDLTNDYAIAYARSFGESDVELIAREGEAVPGLPGAKWSQFLSIALPGSESSFFPFFPFPPYGGEGEGEGGPIEEGPIGFRPANGPIILARIASDSSSGGAAITSANDVGVWAVDGNGELRLLLREGDTVKVNGVEKQVKSMTLLNSVSGSRDVSRSFNERGEVIVRVQFTDRSQAVLTLRIPVQEADPRGV